MRTLYLSPSGLAAYENCPRMYFYERVLRARTVKASSNLGFGSAFASAMEAFLRAELEGKVIDAVKVFEHEWSAFTATHNVEYKKSLCRETLTRIGRALVSQLPTAWRRSGFSVVVDRFGKPMIERKLMTNIGNGVVLVTKLDLVVMDGEGQMFVIDAKTPASPTTVTFTLMGDQLTAYQLAVQAHLEMLGLPPVEGVGYWEAIKRDVPKTGRGVGPVIQDPVIVDPRTDGDIEQFVKKVHSVADRIRAEDFHKTPRMAWNSPCGGCPVADACARRDTTGLVFPSPAMEQVAMRMAA